MWSCTNVDAFSKVRHTSTGFPKRCDRILISDKGIFKTHLREAYIMMIMCDTEIRTYVLLKKGQTAAARKKKWDFLDFPVGLPNLRGRKSGTSWVWKLMEALQILILEQWLFSFVWFWLCWGLTTRQPLWVILCRLPEKGRKEIEEIVEEMKETIREEIGTGMKVKKQKK